MADPREFDPATVLVRAAAAKREAQIQAEMPAKQQQGGVGAAFIGGPKSQDHFQRQCALELAVQFMGPCNCDRTRDYEGAAAACTEIAAVFYGYLYGPATPAESSIPTEFVKLGPDSVED